MVAQGDIGPAAIYAGRMGRQRYVPIHAPERMRTGRRYPSRPVNWSRNILAQIASVTPELTPGVGGFQYVYPALPYFPHKALPSIAEIYPAQPSFPERA